MKEIERKYLLKDSILSLIKEHGLEKYKITQFYTTISPDKGVRYRQMNDRYFKTVKHGSGPSREELEVEISETKFQKKHKDRIKEPIRKDRYMFDFKGKEYAIDVFKKDLKGLFFLEIEFPDMEAFEAFELPDTLKRHIIKDVSFDESFRNKNLVLHGRLQSAYDPDAIFRELDAKSIDTLDAYFIPDLLPIDAMRVILYKYTLSILAYRKRIIKQDEIEDLHQFRINIRKSRAFLKEFGFLIPKKHLKYFNEHLSDFATQTNQKRDLDVIKDRLLQLDESHDIIQKDIRQKQKKEQKSIREMLKNKTFDHFFQAYQQALTQETLITSENNRGNIDHTAKKVIIDLHRHIIQKITDLEKDFDAKKLHKIRISFKRLRYLLEEFQHIFGEKKIEKMIKKGKKLQNLLGDFNDTVNQAKLLHHYFKDNKKKIAHSKRLEYTLLAQTSQIEVKLMIKAKKKLHKFKEKTLEI